MIATYFKIGILLLLVTTAWADDRVDPSILLSAKGIAVTKQDFQQQLLLLPEAERIKVLAEPNSLKGFLRLIYQNKSMAVAAEQLKLDQDPLVQAQLVSQRQQILAEALREYTRKQIQSPDFAALAREHYAARRDEFQLPQQFKAAHIMKKVQCDCEREKQRQALEQIQARLQAGEDFAALAKVESDDIGSAKNGGDLGRWLIPKDLVPPFTEALEKLQIGQNSGIVETQFGFHIIKKLDEQPAHLQSFEEVQPSLEQHLKENYVKDQLVQRATDYLPPADAKFDETAIESLLPGH